MSQKPLATILRVTLLGIVWVFSNTSLNGQVLQATASNVPPFTPQNLIQNIFLGEGVEVTNITYQGDPIAVGYFTGGQPSVGIDRGIVLTTGRVTGNNANFGCADDGADQASNANAGGTNESDLDNLVGLGLNDVAVYTITFIPTSDTLRFRYCFASEEYPEFACTSFNDVFGFFIQGPGYATPTNIAIIPGTSLPVTINNIHPANPNDPTCVATNATYFNNNNGSNNQPVYDGFTDVFVAQAIVTPCEEYTIKLAIADVGDTAYDSGVFLEAKSFGTGSIRTEVATISLDGTVTEGCAVGSITFSLPTPAAQAIPLDYNIWGSAVNGVDYAPIQLGQSIPAGADHITFTLDAFEDHVMEGTEFVAIDIQSDPCNRDTVYLYIRENALVAPALRPDTVICANGQSLELDGTLPIPVPQPSVFTNDQNYSVSPTNTAVFSSVNVFGVQPITLQDGVIRSVCINVNHNWVDDLDVFLISPGGQFIELTTDNGANGDNYTQTCFTPTAVNNINFPGPFAPASSAPFSGNFKPEGVWSDLWGGPTNGVWKLQVIDDTNGVVGEIQDWSITFEPSYKVEYAWTPVVNNSCPTCPVTDVTPDQDTEYIVVATDSYGCIVSDSVTIEAKPVLSAPQINCGASTSNSVTFEWDQIPGATSYEINVNGTGWIMPQTDTSHIVAGVAANTNINIEVRGINNQFLCGATIGTGTCVYCIPPTANYTTTDVTCFNDTDGQVQFNVVNVNPPYSFRVGSAANSTGLFTGLAAGNYTGIVTNGAGCDTTILFTINTPPALTSAVITQHEVSCFGGNDGVLAGTFSGGTGPYDIIWNDPALQSSPVIGGLTAGAYELRITDTKGCVSVASGTVTQPDLLVANTVPGATLCNGTATGTLTAAGEGGTEPFNFSWSNGTSGNTIPNVSAGIYLLTITDSQGCTASTDITILDAPVLQVTVNSIATTCSYKNDGRAISVVSGGTAPYNYQWSDPLSQTTPIATGLSTSFYTVTVTDGNLCTQTAIAAITAPPVLSVSLSTTSPDCNGGNNGTITATPAGGNGNYQYLWNTPGLPQLTPVATGLPFGTYTVTITDNAGCTTASGITVSQPDVLLASTLSLPATCFGYTDGYAKVNITGGTTPYSYLWSSGQTQSSISSQPSGTYTVSVTDAHNCTVVATEFIEQPLQITAAFTPVNILCYNGYSGSITTEITGGSGSGYSTVWFGPYMFLSTEPSNDSLYAGTYTATITDSKGCSTVETVTLNEPQAPLQLVLPYISDTICFDASDGVAKIFPQGGTTPYSYQWDDPANQTVQFPSGLPVSLYRVTVTDANGCYQIDSTYIYQKNPLFAYITPYKPRCFNGSDGYASIDFVSYGSTPSDPDLIDFIWDTSPEQQGRLATNLSANTTYMITATDVHGCTATQEVFISNQEELTGFFNGVIHNTCFGSNDGQAVVNGSGGTDPYTYLWSPNNPTQTAAVAENLAPGFYQVTVTDDRDCQAVVELEILTPPVITTSLAPANVLCFGAQTGNITLAADGGVAPFTYLWNSGEKTQNLTNIAAGTYFVTVTDTNGCIKTDSMVVTQPQSALDALLLPTDATCFGANDGRIELTGTGGVPPYKYTLNNRPWNGSPVQIGLKAGTYLPRIQDANGCITDLPPTDVGQRDAIEIDLGPDITIELGESTQLLANISNGLTPLQISWNKEDSLWLSCMACADPFVDSLLYQNTFEIYVVDALGCIGESSINVIVDKPRKVYVPTGFTPNDDQANDDLLVHGQVSARILDFRIFDRWGEMVFQTTDFRPNDLTKGWDGTFRGKPMPPDVYVWTLEVEYLDGVKEVLHGHTNLIR